MQKSWHNPTNKRYYHAWLHKDLFGDWIVTLSWGGAYHRGGQCRHIYCETYMKGLEYMAAMEKRRLSRGYINNYG